MPLKGKLSRSGAERGQNGPMEAGYSGPVRVGHWGEEDPGGDAPRIDTERLGLFLTPSRTQFEQRWGLVRDAGFRHTNFHHLVPRGDVEHDVHQRFLYNRPPA